MGPPAGGDGGYARLRRAEMRPPLFFRLAERKVAAAAVEKKPLCVQIPPIRAGLDKYGSRARRHPCDGAVSCRVRLNLWEQRWCFPAFGGVGAAFGVVDERPVLLAPRVPLRYALPGLFREGNPGPACIRGVCRRHFLWASAKGRGLSPLPFESFQGGPGGNRNPPGFLFGGRGGTLLFSKEKCPPSSPSPPEVGGKNYFSSNTET